MPAKTRIALLTILCLTLTALPAWAGSWSYENGPINGNVDAWTINFGFTVSDSYLATGSSVNGFEFGVRLLPGTVVTGVDWILSTGPCSDPGSGCGTIVGFGTATSNLTDQFLFFNMFGYQIDLITVSNLNVPEISGTGYYLTLANATTVQPLEPVYWDENSGVGCHSPGCPSIAYENTLGTIPSEDFTIGGGSGGGTTPEPGSILLFGSGVLGLAGLLRRKWNI
jgi:PEP-CTERM motif